VNDFISNEPLFALQVKKDSQPIHHYRFARLFVNEMKNIRDKPAEK